MTFFKTNCTSSTDFLDCFLYDLLNGTETYLSKSSSNRSIHDIIENDNEYIIEIPMPGVKKDDIIINVENNKLNIFAKRKENNDLKYNRKETYFGEYDKTFKLPDIINKENIEAEMIDGVLKITIPKLENNPNIRKIDIK